jgi:hypothetical protein
VARAQGRRALDAKSRAYKALKVKYDALLFAKIVPKQERFLTEQLMLSSFSCRAMEKT